MFSSSILYCVFCLLTIRVSSHAIIRPPEQSPSLTFQVEPDHNLHYDDQPSQIWADDPFNSGHPPLSSALNPQTYPQPLLNTPVLPSGLWYKTLPIRLPSPALFYNALSRFLSFAMMNNEPYAHHHHHHDHLAKPIDCSNYTIGQILKWTLLKAPKPSADHSHHSLPLYRLAWLVNTSSPVQQVLDDPNVDITFFAPDDKALTPPCGKKLYSGTNQLPNAYQATRDDQVTDRDASHIFWDALEAFDNDSSVAHMGQVNLGSGEDEEDKEKKKKFFLHAIELVLKYHISPGRKTIHEIMNQSTLPTELPIFPDSKASRFRVRVGLPLLHFHVHGQITLNFFSTFQAFQTRPIVAKNGVIYIIEKAPLLPPLSPLSQLFLFPKITSTLTTALQKTHLDDVLLPQWENKTIPLSADSNLDSTSSFDYSMESVDERVQSVLSSLIDGHDGKLKKESFTIFAPSNHAFRSLGPKANLFLFSPLGQKILRYVLSYHIVPHLIWNTDHCEEIKDGQSTECNLKTESYQTVETFSSFSPLPARDQYFHPHHSRPHHPGKINVTELLLPTLLGSRANQSLPISLVEFRHFPKGPVIRRAYIKHNEKDSNFGSPDKHAIPLIVPDGVAWGGAFHVIPKLIHPPVPAGQHKRKDVQRALELSILTST